MPDRHIASILGRSIDLALTSALRAEVLLMEASAAKHGTRLQIAQVDPAFNFPSRGPFDGKYMRALFDFGVEQGRKGSAFEEAQASRSPVRGAANPSLSGPTGAQ